MNSQTKNCQNCKKKFVIEPEDFDFYDKIKVPPPTFCPECRMQRRMAFRNQNKLFKVKDAFTGEEIFSLVPPESGINVVTQEEWFSDSWDAMEHGMDIDFTKPFLSQLFDLHKQIPQYNLNVARMKDSPYCGNAEDIKNCYMVFNATDNEDCALGTGYYFSKNCIDNCDIYKSESCYGSFWIENCSKTYFSEECRQCSEVWFSKNCTGCLNIVGCVNLRNKSYCIFNVQYSREEYLKKVEEMKLHTWQGVQKIKQESHAFWKKHPQKYIQGIRNLNCNGVYVTESKNVKKSYIVKGGENLKYVQFINESPNRDCYDISVWGSNSELTYEYSSSGSGVYNSKFLVDCWPDIRNTEYSLHCRSSSDLFGCIGLQKKQHCILNKQYTKDEYEILVAKIKQHMIDMPYVDSKGRVYAYGEFFPIEFSWYGYNNTLAQEILPLTKEIAEENNYPWYEIPPGTYTATINAKDLPDDIRTVTDTITREIIQCETCIKKYRIIQDEFEFLKREGIPLPHNCPDCRYAERISHRLKPKLFTRSCMKDGCSETFETGYDPKDGDIVYCEMHYQQEIL
jgi:hypothetical protein